MKTFTEKHRLASAMMTMAMLIFFFTSGCKTPMQERKIALSGFLGDYSRLSPGKSGQAQLVYVNPDAHFSKYTKIIIDPVTVWAIKKSSLAKLPDKDVIALQSYLYWKLKEELSKDYAIVDQPGPDVMELRVALTEAKGGKVVRNTVSSVLPIGIAISTLKLAATGTHTAVGEANIEGELLDSESGRQLAAAVDSRAGRKAVVSGNFTKWGDVQNAFDYWAKQLRLRLENLRAEKDNQ